MIKPFKLEAYFAQHEFTAPHLLCCSDVQSWTIEDLLELASPVQREQWNTLSLGYTQDQGGQKLRISIQQHLYPCLHEENILCFSGAEEGIFCALSVLCQPGDHAVVVTPCYQSLAEVPRSRGCSVTQVALEESEGWVLNSNALKHAIQNNTRVIILNFPHNPTGTMLSQSEMDSIVQLCRLHGIWLFCDEVYYGVTAPHAPLVAPAALSYERALSLGVMSKAYGMPGLRIGWIACQDLTLLKAIREFKHYTTICNSAPSEFLAQIALEKSDVVLARNNEIVTYNSDLVNAFIQKNKGLFSWTRPQGGAIGLVKYHGKGSVDAFVDHIRESAGILLLPLSVYSDPRPYFRIGFGRKNVPEILALFQDYLDEQPKNQLTEVR